MPIAYINFYSDISNTLDRIYDDVFTITAQEENCKVYYICSSENDTKPLYISLDYGYTWTEVNPLPITGSNGTITQMGNTLCTLEKGKSIVLRATDETHSSTHGFEGYHLWTDKKSKVSGHLWSLVDSDNYIDPETPEDSYSFLGLFSNDSNYDTIMGTTTNPCKISDVSSLIFPSFCCKYEKMFKGCTELTKSPLKLPAETLNIRRCYYEMFAGCTKLTNAPYISANVVTGYAGRGDCESMFEGCTSLKETPEILLTAIAGPRMYKRMFKGCTSITNPPVISSTQTLESACESMFEGCTSLVSTPTLLSEDVWGQTYMYMFKDCTALYTINPLGMTGKIYSSGCAYMFKGCTSITTPPELPSTNLDSSVYYGMFEGCTSLTSAPVLPALHLNNPYSGDASGAYSYMFKGCTSLNYINIKSLDDYLSGNFTDWVENVAPRGTFVKDINVTYPIDSNSGVPIGWTIVDEGELQKHVTVTIEPDGSGTVTGAGRYYQNETAILKATPATGWYFAYWEYGTEYYSDIAEIVLIVDSDIEMTAVFVPAPPPPKYNLLVTSEHNNHCTLTGSGRYEENEYVGVVISNIDEGWNFIGWYDGDTRVSVHEEYTVKMPDHDVTLYARLMKYICEFSYGINIEDAGEITCTCEGESLEIGDTYYLGWDSVITLTATANEGYKFSGFYNGSTLLSRENVYEFKLRDDVEITAVYRQVSGDREYWETEYLAIESDSTSNSNDIYISASYSTTQVTYDLYYSFDKYYWNHVTLKSSTSWNTPNTIKLCTINAKDIVYFKGVNNYIGDTDFGGNKCNLRIYANKNYSVKGNIMSLVYGDDFQLYNTLPNTIGFRGIFANSKVTNADMLVLPALTLSTCCYKDMFFDCTSLTTAPELPATTLAEHCYEEMFRYCDSLTTAPELPATTLADHCYSYMFWESGLTTAPQLPATTLADSCYMNMFSNCASLTTPPVLPVTTLANNCYDNMFQGCTSLTTAPELPATTLANNCYECMFTECTSLTTAPELPATTLASGCYESMFRACTGLTTPPALPVTTLEPNCYECMFYGCTSLTAAPQLPATTLAYSCYESMFAGCTSLTTAPVLPATTLAPNCYGNMFNGCTSLSSITALFTTNIDLNPTYYTVHWVENVNKEGTFYKNSSATWGLTGINGIPSRWTVVDAS